MVAGVRITVRAEVDHEVGWQDPDEGEGLPEDEGAQG
jgi:hypothetical protein